MQLTIAAQHKGRGEDTPIWAMDKRLLMHKRLERWIQLQQFVYGLPDEYSYAGRLSDRDGGSASEVLVNVGWMSWYGGGESGDRYHSLGIALLESSEALSTNGTKVFLHSLARGLRRLCAFFRAGKATVKQTELVQPKKDELLAS